MMDEADDETQRPVGEPELRLQGRHARHQRREAQTLSDVGDGDGEAGAAQIHAGTLSHAAAGRGQDADDAAAPPPPGRTRGRDRAGSAMISR